MDDNFKKDLIELLDAQFEQKFIRLFNQGFRELVVPYFEDLDKRLTKIEYRVDQIDNKLDVMNVKYLDHDKRIKDIETIPVVAHSIKK